MVVCLKFSQGALLSSNSFASSASIQQRPWPISRWRVEFRCCGGFRSFSVKGSANVIRKSETESYEVEFCDRVNALPHVQTLRRFPKEQLQGKVVLVRFDSAAVLQKDPDSGIPLNESALSTIKYIHDAGAKVVMLTNWRVKGSAKLQSLEEVAEYLSSVLQLQVLAAQAISTNAMTRNEAHESGEVFLLNDLSGFKEEMANDLEFAKRLSMGIDIFVNDSFLLAHKVLGSTVGITRFCCASIAGFHFEERLNQLKKIAEGSKHPYIAIIGGGNLAKKSAALQALAAKCDGIAFVGVMAFQLMHALGMEVPLKLLEHNALRDAKGLICCAASRGIPIILPKDFWCTNDHIPHEMEVFPAHGIARGWSPVDLGPVSLAELTSLLSTCKQILWIGPVKFSSPDQTNGGAAIIMSTIEKLSQGNCEVTIVGNAALQKVSLASRSIPACKIIESASVVWEFLKGKNLPGLMSLDRAYPFENDWKAIYDEPAQPLIVDLGSGNGMFLLGMASKKKDLNCLGIEMNERLVPHCLVAADQSKLKNVSTMLVVYLEEGHETKRNMLAGNLLSKIESWPITVMRSTTSKSPVAVAFPGSNGHFIAANATYAFRSVVSGYPGKLVLVSIQCPNPDFNQPDHRWRMVQTSLIEAITDLLVPGGKVFLQSDIKEVAVRMREQFLKDSKGKLAIQHDKNRDTLPGGWLKENPFGVQSDWERHVSARGAPMYRLLLSKLC